MSRDVVVGVRSKDGQVIRVWVDRNVQESALWIRLWVTTRPSEGGGEWSPTVGDLEMLDPALRNYVVQIMATGRATPPPAHATQIYQGLGVLFPPAFWRDVGEEMVQTFADAYRDHRGDRVLWVIGELIALMIAALNAWVDQLRRAMARRQAG